MPIHQERMIALINAALDYKQALERLTNSINKEEQNLKANLTNPAIAFQTISIIANPATILERPQESASTIAIEQYHFSRNIRRNAREAAKAAERRRLEGKPQRGSIINPYSTLELVPGALRQPQQTRRGGTPQVKPLYIPGELSDEQRKEIDKYIEDHPTVPPRNPDLIIEEGYISPEDRRRINEEDDFPNDL